jgi:hypothetical protein
MILPSAIIDIIAIDYITPYIDAIMMLIIIAIDYYDIDYAIILLAAIIIDYY